MSAAAPLPPPSPPRSGRNSASYGEPYNVNNAKESSRQWPIASGSGFSNNGRPPPPIPHILDLQARATQAINPYASVHNLSLYISQ